jgi:hypothetical protein
MVSGSTSLSRLHVNMIDLESGSYAARECANIIGFAPRKSTVALPRPKPAAQSRTHPDASLRVQRSILLNPSVGQMRAAMAACAGNPANHTISSRNRSR